MRSTRFAPIALLLAAAIWGIAFLFQKEAMRFVGPFTFIAARSALATAALAPLSRWELRAAPSQVKCVRLGLSAGFVFFAAAFLQQQGIRTATVTNTGFLTSLYVVLTPLMDWVRSRVAPSRVVWAAVVLAGAGTWLLGGASLGAFSAGDGLVALSSFFWALHVVLCSIAARSGHPIAFTNVQFAAVGALGVAFAVVFESPTWTGLRAAAGAIAYVGLLSSALTFTVLTWAMRHVGAAEASILVSSETVFAALAAYAFLGERLPGPRWAGAVLILLATLLPQLPLRQWAARIDAARG